MLHSLLLVAVGLRVPSPVPSLLEPAALHSLIKALPPAQMDDWRAAVLKAKSERGIAWMAIARENVHVACQHNLTSLATPAQWVSDRYVGMVLNNRCLSGRVRPSSFPLFCMSRCGAVLNLPYEQLYCSLLFLITCIAELTQLDLI